MTAKRSVLPQIIGIVLVYLLACLIEPCDGHGCDKEVASHVGR